MAPNQSLSTLPTCPSTTSRCAVKQAFTYLSPHPRLASPPSSISSSLLSLSSLSSPSSPSPSTTSLQSSLFLTSPDFRITSNHKPPSLPSLCIPSFPMCGVTALVTLLLTVTVVINGVSGSLEEFHIDVDVVKNMVRTFGRELSSASTEQTCLGRIEENFQNLSSEVSWFDGNKMMDDMRMDVMNMLNWKRHAVERIANESERLASNHTYDKSLEVHYHNVKKFAAGTGEEGSSVVNSGRESHFDNAEVDLEHSAIHVPINVFEESPDVINDIKWSEALTPFFKNNLAFDPSLSWQFFGSARGFLRLYPSTAWREPPNFQLDKPQPDFYDARMRTWYIRGAASPKDVVILLDTSGSMTGFRKKIAQSVVDNILDTLTADDYVAALQFAKEVSPISDCLDTMVQANKKNIAEIRGSLSNVKTSDLVNFTAALEEAFSLLQNFNKTGQGSQCNQAIMIVTDGAPANYEEIFKRYNWPNIPVRVFTYLIGHDSTSHSEVYWMACHNRGYYTHVANLAEVREQVQKYIPVMSRPIVLSGQRVFSWTQVYAPNSELELDDWTWESKQSSEIIQSKRVAAQSQVQLQDSAPAAVETPEDIRDRRNTKLFERSISESDPTSETKTKPETDDKETETELKEDPKPSALQSLSDSTPSKKDHTTPLYITLSTPVFDTRNYTNITKRILIKNVYQESSEPELVRIANLLGVAGIDVPINEIIKLTPAFKLGVNAYVFIISNNGYILYHPDLRPFFQDFLKPYYNSVDLSEVELAHNNLGAREWDPEIESIRNNMINRTHGWKKVTVKLHLDDMRRVVTRTNHYTHGMITNTPFSLAIALPEPYGSYRLTSQVDLRMKHRVENFTTYFRGSQWRVHPDWAYCSTPHRPQTGGSGTGHSDGGGGGSGSGGARPVPHMTPEEEIVHFLSHDLEKQSFRWRTSSIRPQVYETVSCDKDLIQSLVLDAKLTDIPRDSCNMNTNFRDEQRIKTFGIVTTFVATRSGLTRFQDYRREDEIKSAFYEEHPRAIEETYYRRAVDFYTQNRDAFVYSVEFDAGRSHEGRAPSAANFLVTATHALFIGNGKQSTPVAVVGIQFRYSVLHEFFLNITAKFNVPCTHMDVDCYLVDNNGFVVLSNHRVADVGRFFGRIDGDVVNELVAQSVFRRVHMFDYQAICLYPEAEASAPSAGVFAFSVLHRVWQAMATVGNVLAAMYVHTLYGDWRLALAALVPEPTYDAARQDWTATTAVNDVASAAAMPSVVGYEPFFKENRTTAKPCDNEFDLYELVDFSNQTRTQEIACTQNPACTRKYIAQYVPHSNLMMILVVNNPMCACHKTTVDIEHKELHYGKRYCELLRTEKNRKRPTTCHNYHPQEKDIKQCGGATTAFVSWLSTLTSLTLSTLLYRFHASA